MQIDCRQYYFQHTLSREKGKMSSPFFMLYGLVSQRDQPIKNKIDEN